MPENYKSWLDLYQYGMKKYLEWYIYKIEKKTIELPEINYDWTKRDNLDQLFSSRMNNK